MHSGEATCVVALGISIDGAKVPPAMEEHPYTSTPTGKSCLPGGMLVSVRSP
ncbi:hypothetical protein [Nonomuraea recticatena]|uniref:Uncharacterized protein n=1 Tax=Nonomuraea recticatena TaxID=46178 RepID=A0ABN3TFU3_9ACTN